VTRQVGRKFALFPLTLHDYAPILAMSSTICGQNSSNVCANERLPFNPADE
jgi:hypothetical protein